MRIECISIFLGIYYSIECDQFENDILGRVPNTNTYFKFYVHLLINSLKENSVNSYVMSDNGEIASTKQE